MAKKPKIGGLLDDVAEKVIKPKPQGFRAYHASPYDFDTFKPSNFRGSSFFASTPEKAKNGASAGQAEYGMEAAITGERKPFKIYEVNIDGSKIKGLALTPYELQWRETLPQIIPNDDALEAIFKKAPNQIWWDDLYDVQKLGDRKYRYLKKNEPPIISYEEALKTNRDIYHTRFPHYGAAADEKLAAQNTLKEKMGGYLVHDEGGLSVAVADPSIISIIRKYGLIPGGLLGAGAVMAPSNADAAPSRPDWIGPTGNITGNPPWLRPDPNERSTLGKLYDAVTTNPIGTFKAAGSAIGDAVKGYLGEVRQDPGKGVADALELGATAMGGAAPQAFWMATSPSEANAGEDAILAQRRKMMQGLLAD